MSLSSIRISKTAESSTKWKYSVSCLSLGFAYTGDEISADALCILCNKVLPNSSVLCARPCRYCGANYPECKDRCGARGGVVVKALRYKPAGRGFDSRWCHWNFSAT